MRAHALVVVAMLVFSLSSPGEEKKQAPDGNTVCTFADGQQVSVRYPEIAYAKPGLPRGKAWTPSNRPIYMFSQAKLQFGSATLPPGAYSLYVVAGQETWVIIANRNVEQGAAYDSSKDAAKLQAQIGELPTPSSRLSLYFGRISPTTCTLRIDYGKQRAFADLAQK